MPPGAVSRIRPGWAAIAIPVWPVPTVSGEDGREVGVELGDGEGGTIAIQATTMPPCRRSPDGLEPHSG